MLLLQRLSSWAAQYNPWLLIKLMPKGVVFSCLSETELEQMRHEVEAAQGQAQYLNQQWADIHADLLEERDRHEVRTPFTSCPHTSLTP